MRSYLLIPIPHKICTRSVLQDLYDGFIIILDDRIKYVNPLFASNFGYELQDVLDHNFQEFVHPDEIENIWQYYGRWISGEQVSVNLKLCWLTSKVIPEKFRSIRA